MIPAHKSAPRKLISGVLLASAMSLVQAGPAQAAMTKAECQAKAKADYDNALNACYQWASDPDPYRTCINDAGYAHHIAYKRCQRLPNVPTVDRATLKASSR